MELSKTGLDLLIEACDQRAQHPAVVVQPPGAEVNGKKICSKTYILRNATEDETSGTIHMLVFFFIMY